MSRTKPARGENVVESLGETWILSGSTGQDKHQGSYVKLKIALEFPHKNVRLRFVRESGWSDFVKGLGVVECQSGDKTFDDLVYINTDSPHIHRLLKSNSSLRQAIGNMLANEEVQSVEVEDGQVFLRTRAYGKQGNTEGAWGAIFPKIDFSYQFECYKTTATNLIEFRETLLRNWGHDAFNWDGRGITKGLILNAIGVASALLLMYFLNKFLIEDKYGHLVDSLQFFVYGILPSLITFVILIGLGLLWMRGSSWTLRFLIPFLILSLFISPALVYSGAKYINYAESTFFKSVDAPIYSFEVVLRKSKNSSRYVCMVQSQNPVESQKILREDYYPEFCNELKQKRSMSNLFYHYELQKGKLGAYWYTSKAVVTK
ncbi:hypothetical protein [Bdellovibrio bacteriovorus]|uniref:hypothetical protein n=1 Tax=Bdellovibrio bacteriovorus TaxID=959 RepID=UPI0035A5DCEF